MPVTSPLLDQAPNAIERKFFAMTGCQHPKGNHQAFLRGLAHLYNLVPYQRRAQHAGQCGVEVEGGTVPTRDWLLNLQILTSGGLRGAMTRCRLREARLLSPPRLRTGRESFPSSSSSISKAV